MKKNTLSFDVHWYRRVFHTFAACFLIYYMLPDVEWVNIIKIWLPISIVTFAILLELLRVKGKINSDHFFGLRMYEKNRIGSYLYFGIAVFILLIFFPQKIAIPCILCGCFADPLIGEIRNHFGKIQLYLAGFLICMIFFVVAWYKADLWVGIFMSIVGATGAVMGEVKKFSWLDDDFMIQIIPAVMLIVLWMILVKTGIVDFSFIEQPVIYPLNIPW